MPKLHPVSFENACVSLAQALRIFSPNGDLRIQLLI